MSPKKAPAKKAYAAAGVDVDLGNKVKATIPELVASTRRPEVLSAIGGFGGLFNAAFPAMREPILVSSIDGVGTKLKVASMMRDHSTIGADLVNHCVNDIAVLGAEPLFFLDYMGTSQLDPKQFRQILSGITKACKQTGCALIGGETAQMPGLYHGEDYDLVGAIVGVVDRKKIIDGSTIKPGDALVGFPSSGLHTNGYSLARKTLFTHMKLGIRSKVPGSRLPLGKELLRTHVNYQPLLKNLSATVKFKGLAHITGGGLIDNLPRILPKGTAAEIVLGTWPEPPIFRLLTSHTRMRPAELYQTYNMGIGMVAVVSRAHADKIIQSTNAYYIGCITTGDQNVILV